MSGKRQSELKLSGNGNECKPLPATPTGREMASEGVVGGVGPAPWRGRSRRVRSWSLVPSAGIMVSMIVDGGGGGGGAARVLNTRLCVF